MRVNVHVERLVLEGVSILPGQSHLLQASVAAELTRLLADRGVSHNLMAAGAVPQVFSTDIRLASGTGVAQLGERIAGSVFGGIGE